MMRATMFKYLKFVAELIVSIVANLILWTFFAIYLSYQLLTSPFRRSDDE